MKHHPRRDQSGGAYRKLRARVFREEDICWLCSRPVDKTLPGTHPWGPTLDHDHPWSTTQDNSRDNVHLAHRNCNERKSDGKRGPLSDPLPTSRQW